MNEQEQAYKLLVKQAKELIDTDLDNSANICSILSFVKHQLDLFWLGIYIVRGDTLFLGTFQGLTACTKIPLGKGACGVSASEGCIVILNDVNAYPGYIACHTETKSEMVIPGFKNDVVSFVLDIDSTQTGRFDDMDAEYMNKIAEIITPLVNQ